MLSSDTKKADGRSFRLLFVLIFLFLLFAGCESGRDEEEFAALPTTVTAVEKPLFSSDFEARQAVLTAIELPYAAEQYTSDSLMRYDELSASLAKNLSDITVSNAEEWLSLIAELLNGMELKENEPLPLPRISIRTSDGSVHHSYSRATVTVDYPEGYTEGVRFTVDNAEIKLRGNSTIDAPKHPYTIKFEEKRSLCGMDKGKRWVLLANLFDKTQLRNKLALDFCQNLRFDYSPEGEFADVYVNGTYMGVYLVCEPVTDGKNRVDIDVEQGDFLIELESERSEAGVNYIYSSSGVRFKVNKPDEVSFDEAKAIRAAIDEIERQIREEPFAVFSEVVDIPSFVDFYIFKEYFKDVDAYYSSTRFYWKDGKFYAGPPWDCDLTCGNASPDYPEVKYWSYCNVNGYGTGTEDSADGEWNDFGWFAMLWANEEFREAVRQRWEEIRPLCENVFRDNELGQNRIDALLGEYRDDIDRNYEKGGWSLTETYSSLEITPAATYDEDIAFLRAWLERRILVVDELFQ